MDTSIKFIRVNQEDYRLTGHYRSIKNVHLRIVSTGEQRNPQHTGREGRGGRRGCYACWGLCQSKWKDFLQKYLNATIQILAML